MIDRRLDRLLWRWEFGSVAPEMLALELRERLQRLRDESIGERDSATVRLWDATLISSYDDAFHTAARLLDRARWRLALKEIHRCERLITSMRALIEAAADVDRAAAVMEQVHELAATAVLRRLPAVASLAQTVDQARQCIAEGRSTQASQLAGICLRLGRALQERRPVASGESADLQNRIGNLRELCVATRPFADGTDDEPAHDGTLSALQSLFAHQYSLLGTRLLSELEVRLAGRRRFLLHIKRRRLDGSAPMSVEEMRALVRERSWDGAVDHHWHQSIASYAGVLQEQFRRADAIAAALQTSIIPSGDEP